MILHAKNIEKSYGKKKVLNGISLKLKIGRMYGIAVENGSGKSTLLKSLIGYTKIQKGSVAINGDFGYCPQLPHFFDQLTVEEHFKYFCAAYDIEQREAQSPIQFLLERLNFQKYFKYRISELSGGTIQKLNLAISLLNFPDLLILDEPYNGFDWDTYLRFWDLTDDLKEKGITVLIVSHFINDLKRFDCSYELKNGQLYEIS